MFKIECLPVASLSGCIDATNLQYNAENQLVSADPAGKLRWDPTLNRKWKLKWASYSTRRGLSAEVYDLNAGLLDNDFPSSFIGTAPCPNDSVPNSHGGIMPWSHNLLSVILVENGRLGGKVWQKVQYDERLTKPLPSAKNVEVHFTETADVKVCIAQIVDICGDKEPQEFGSPGPVFAVSVHVEGAEQLKKIKALGCVVSAKEI